MRSYSYAARLGRVSLLLAVVALLSAASCKHDDLSSSNRQFVTMPNGKQIVLVGIADDEAERSRGLSEREQLAPQEGMWFVFDREGYYPFWMKDMKFSLDIIWLNDDYQVVDIARYVPPAVGVTTLPQYQNAYPAKYVLEVNAGVSEGLSRGDKLNLMSGI